MSEKRIRAEVSLDDKEGRCHKHRVEIPVATIEQVVAKVVGRMAESCRVYARESGASDSTMEAFLGFLGCCQQEIDEHTVDDLTNDPEYDCDLWGEEAHRKWLKQFMADVRELVGLIGAPEVTIHDVVAVGSWWVLELKKYRMRVNHQLEGDGLTIARAKAEELNAALAKVKAHLDGPKADAGTSTNTETGAGAGFDALFISYNDLREAAERVVERDNEVSARQESFSTLSVRRLHDAVAGLRDVLGGVGE